MAPIVSFTKSLSRIFPPDDPDSPWLIRLAILRDDFSYELSQIGLKPDDPPDAVWRCSYMLRKVGITIGEISDIFCDQIARRVPDLEAKYGAPVGDRLTKAIAAVRAADEYLKPLRDSLGAHMEPKFSNKRKDDPTRTVIEAHGDSEFHLVLDLHNGKITSMREFTAAAFLFAWPDVKTLEDFARKHDELSDKLFGCMAPAIHTIDIFFLLHFRKLGLTSA